ncbi:heterokaryon incompatibility protein-domain-containing protein [Xylaria telfairii]|nr:heterokaryon incompatibility protein-domain-containing protein [Xylaria telfairii]
MSLSVKECISTYTELLQVQGHCPERPYVELMVPSDARKILSITFTIVSRDQGWADEGGFSYSWFDTVVQRRTLGLTDLPSYTICANRTGNPEFFEHQTRWDCQSEPHIRLWTEALQRGDIISILPRAIFPARVNIIREASIKIQYDAYEEERSETHTGADEGERFYIRSLEANEHEIRILVVEPGLYDELIVCSFDYSMLKENGSIASPPNFDALSYCWGNSPGDSYILLNPDFHIGGSIPRAGRKFAVGRNVETGLRRLRQKDKAIRIWIDAICINQTDDEERAQQVSIMNLIYSYATTVHIWLGEGNLVVDAALCVVHELVNLSYGACPGADLCHCLEDGISKHNVSTRDAEATRPPGGVGSLSAHHVNQAWSLIKSVLSRQLSKIGDNFYSGEVAAIIGGLYQHAWFTRVWVLQEAILARRAFIRSGTEVIPFEEVISASNLIHDIRHKGGWLPHIKWRAALAPIWLRLGKSSPAFVQERESQIGSGIETNESELPASVGSKPIGILDVFIDALVMRATDPRDKLFALLSFAYDISDPTGMQENQLKLDRLIRPNYSKSIAVVFADFTRWWIHAHQSLAILSYIHADPARSWRRMTSNQRQSTGSASDLGKTPQRPTWSIGTNGRASWARATLDSQFSFHATGTTTPCLGTTYSDANFDGDNERLTLRVDGLHVSNITKIGHFPVEKFFPYGSKDAMNGDNETGDGRGQSIRAVFHKIFDPCGLHQFWTLEADPGEDTHYDLARARSCYSDHLRTHWAYCPREKLLAMEPPPADRDDEGSAKLYKTSNLPTCLEPCFFVATGGYYGLCPWTAQEGDMVVLLYGGNIPYLLRPVDKEKNTNEGSASAEDMFELVGECYTQGIMHGEFLNGRGGENSQKVGTRTFTLV